MLVPHPAIDLGQGPCRLPDPTSLTQAHLHPPHGNGRHSPPNGHLP